MKKNTFFSLTLLLSVLLLCGACSAGNPEPFEIPQDFKDFYWETYEENPIYQDNYVLVYTYADAHCYSEEKLNEHIAYSISDLLLWYHTLNDLEEYDGITINDPTICSIERNDSGEFDSQSCILEIKTNDDERYEFLFVHGLMRAAKRLSDGMTLASSD